MSDVGQATLPPTWVVARLEELFVPLEDGRLLHHGWSPQCEKEPAAVGEWGVLKTTAIQAGEFRPEHNKRLPTSLSPRPQHEVKSGDLLITCAGPRVRCGVPCLVRSTRPKLMLSGKMYRFRVSDECFDARYLEKYLLSHSAQTAIDAMKTGGNESGLNLTHDRFKPLSVPVAPLQEQRRIASKIEEVFSRVDEGERALRRVQVLVERYRQSVLKAAVTGELTREWREENKSKLEPGEVLHARILEARRRASDTPELKRSKRRGSDKPTDSPEKVVSVDSRDLPELPFGWTWAPAEAICESVHSGTTPESPLLQATPSDGVPFIKVQNLTFDGLLDFSVEPTYVDAEHHNRRMGRSRTLPGDVLTNIVGPPLGKVSVVPSTYREWNVNQAVVGFRPLHGMRNDFLSIYLQSSVAKGWLRATTKTTTSQVNLAVTTCRRLPVPVPSLLEQGRVCEIVEKALSYANTVLATAEKAATLAAALRQATLKAAFSGRLVPQLQTDEPAAFLLERIAVERSAHGHSAKRSRSRKSGV
jgi:type I restriction enzyme, S subunit